MRPYFYLKDMDNFKPTTYEDMIDYLNKVEIKSSDIIDKKNLIKNYDIPSYYYKQLINRDYSDKYIFVVFPWLFDALSITMSYKEYEDFKKDMLKFIEDNYSSMEIKAIKNVASLYEISSQNIHIDISKLSSLAYFKYLIGATFPYISINYKELLEINEEKATLFKINATYNLTYPNSIVKYKDVEIKYRILDPSTISEYNSSITYKPPKKIAKEMYDVEKLGNETKYLIVIDYNNGYYTVAKFGSSIYVDKSFIEDLKVGKLDIFDIVDDIINTRIKYEFYNKTKTIQNRSVDELKKNYLSLQSLAFSVPLTNLQTYASELSKAAFKASLLDPDDEPYFQKYVELMNIEFNEENRNNIVNYVMNYVYPDLLTTTK